MEITEVRIKLMDEAGDRLQAFCSITFDDAFVIRDLKIIEGTHGPFVAMPSRKLTSRCPQCGCKNHLRAAHCNQCGTRLKEDRAVKDESGRAKLYADIAHPINSACREMIQERIIAEFFQEIDRSKQPGYVSRYEDFDAGEDFAQPIEPAAMHRENAARREKDAAHELPQAPHHVPAPSEQPEPVRPTEVRKPAAQSNQQKSQSQSPQPHSPQPHSPQANQPPHKPPQRQMPPIPGVNRDTFGAGIF